MQQKFDPSNIFGNVQSTWEQALETGRKNFQAMTEVNQRAVQGWQALAQRQSEMVTQFLQDNGMPSYTEATTTQDRIGKQADAIQSAYQRGLANSQELAQIASKCTKEAVDVISKRVTASVSELSAAAKSAAKE